MLQVNKCGCFRVVQVWQVQVKDSWACTMNQRWCVSGWQCCILVRTTQECTCRIAVLVMQHHTTSLPSRHTLLLARRDWFQLTLKEGLTVFRDQVGV